MMLYGVCRSCHVQGNVFYLWIIPFQKGKRLTACNFSPLSFRCHRCICVFACWLLLLCFLILSLCFSLVCRWCRKIKKTSGFFLLFTCRFSGVLFLVSFSPPFSFSKFSTFGEMASSGRATNYIYYIYLSLEVVCKRFCLCLSVSNFWIIYA